MISEFISSWSLFGVAYLTAIAGAVVLSLVGVYVIARDQLFMAAAVSQSSMLGVATTLFLGKGNPALIAVLFSISAAVLINFKSSRNGVTHQESTGWVFLVASALSILLLVKQPFGLKQVQSMAASSMIGSTIQEAIVFGVLGLACLTLVMVCKGKITLWLSDPIMAAAVGIRIGMWSLAAALLLGLTSGMMIRSTGLLYTFACLVLPALSAKYLSRNIGTMFWLAPLIAVIGVLPGLIIAHGFDFPPGQVVVITLAVLTALASLFKKQ